MLEGVIETEPYQYPGGGDGDRVHPELTDHRECQPDR